MDCRKMAWLAGGVMCLLAGCAHHDPQQFVPQQPPAPPKPPAAATSSRQDKNPKEDSTVLQAKPISCVRIGDCQAAAAADPERSPAEREEMAQRAKASYMRALQIEPKFVPAHLALGALYVTMGQYAEALGAYRTAIQLESQNQAAIMAYARVQERMENRPGALKTLQWAVTAMPREPALWYEQGMCLGRAKEFDAALDSLQHAAQLRPTNNDYNKAVGLMLARMGRPDEALPWLAKAKMSEADAHYNLARMLRHIGRDDASREQLDRALQADPNHIEAMQMLSDAQPAQPTEPIRTATYRPEESEQPVATLPARPSEPQPQTPQPKPLSPVVFDAWDVRPAPPSLREPAPAPKSEPKSRPDISVGFEANP